MPRALLSFTIILTPPKEKFRKSMVVEICPKVTFLLRKSEGFNKNTLKSKFYYVSMKIC